MISRKLGALKLLCTRNASTFRFDAEGVMKMIARNKFTTTVSDGFTVISAVNGGLVMSIAVNAAQQVSQHRDPLSMTGYYVNKVQDDASIDVDTEILSVSKTTSTIQVSLSQLGSLRTRFIGTFGTLDGMKGLNHNKLPSFQLPPVEHCEDGGKKLRDMIGSVLKIAHRAEFRLAKEDPYLNSFLSGKPGNDASLHCWVAFADGRVPCIRSLAYFSDGLPPCVLNLVDKFTWVPTLEYTVYFWNHPAETDCIYWDNKYWFRIKFESKYVNNSLLYTDGEIWNAHGTKLLATSRQFAKILAAK